MTATKTTARIGIYAGTFNPVHTGHIAFALQATQAANLDMVYFMPERRPRDKQEVEHFGHRMAMLRRATEPHTQLDLLDLVDVNFSVLRTLPQLQQTFPDSQLVFLVGSDVAPTIPSWPHSERVGMLAAVEGGGGGGGDAPAVKAMPTGEIIPVDAPLSVRKGAVLPLAPRVYTVMELAFMVFPTNSSLLVRSRARA